MIAFDEQPFLDAADILVKADETERALTLLNNLPAFYRDNPPPKIKSMKSEILKKMTLVYDLIGDARELPKSDEWSVQYLNGTARGAELKRLVGDYNATGVSPGIVDMGPGDFTFAIGMKVEGFGFTYECHSLNSEAKKQANERLGSHYGLIKKPDIFVAFEIIEHLSSVAEIRQLFDRYPMPEHVLLSTPKYTFSEGTKNWRTEGIHHLRAYTPREFINVCMDLFPEYELSLIDSEVMVISGRLKMDLPKGSV